MAFTNKIMGVAAGGLAALVATTYHDQAPMRANFDEKANVCETVLGDNYTGGNRILSSERVVLCETNDDRTAEIKLNDNTVKYTDWFQTL